MDFYYVTITRSIAHSSDSYELDFFMNSKQARADFIERFQGMEDLSLNKITKSGNAHFNQAGVLVKDWREHTHV